MTAQVIFAGCRELPRGSGDERAVGPALAAVGVELHWAAWDDPNVDFSAADLVVLRATWDYARRRDDFLAWCDSVPTLRNSAAVARWSRFGVGVGGRADPTADWGATSLPRIRWIRLRWAVPSRPPLDAPCQRPSPIGAPSTVNAQRGLPSGLPSPSFAIPK